MTRKAGIPNKNKRGIKAQLKAQYGNDFDVIMLMGKHCLTLHEIAVEKKDAYEKRKEGEGPDMTLGYAEDDEEEKVTQSEVSNSAKTVIDALEKLAQYVEPKLKSIDLSGEVKTWTVIVKDLSGDEEEKGEVTWPGDEESDAKLEREMQEEEFNQARIRNDDELVTVSSTEYAEAVDDNHPEYSAIFDDDEGELGDA